MPVRTERYLRLPFRGRNFFVEEGWYYSNEERHIHRYRKHWGIDFRLKRGTPILAAHAGFALASYQHHVRTWRGDTLVYQGKPVGFGFGYHVVIWQPERKRGTLYAHLEQPHRGLPLIKPQGTWPKLRAKLIDLSPAGYARLGKWVRSGEVIGWCGDSGCT